MDGLPEDGDDDARSTRARFESDVATGATSSTGASAGGGGARRRGIVNVGKGTDERGTIGNEVDVDDDIDEQAQLNFDCDSSETLP
jgi:hypothetical protein